MSITGLPEHWADKQLHLAKTHAALEPQECYYCTKPIEGHPWGAFGRKFCSLACKRAQDNQND